MPQMYSDFYDSVKRALRATGMSLSAVLRRANLSAQEFYDSVGWMPGFSKGPPPRERYEAVARAIGVPLEELWPVDRLKWNIWQVMVQHDSFKELATMRPYSRHPGGPDFAFEKLGRLAGLSETETRDLYWGIRDPGPDGLRKIAEALNVPLAQISPRKSRWVGRHLIRLSLKTPLSALVGALSGSLIAGLVVLVFVVLGLLFDSASLLVKGAEVVNVSWPNQVPAQGLLLLWPAAIAIAGGMGGLCAMGLSSQHFGGLVGRVVGAILGGGCGSLLGFTVVWEKGMEATWPIVLLVVVAMLIPGAVAAFGSWKLAGFCADLAFGIWSGDFPEWPF